MKNSLKNILNKTITYTKLFIKKIINNLKFLNKKSSIINTMYAPIFEKKINNINELSSELNTLKKELDIINAEIYTVKKQNELYNKKINSLTSFQIFILNNNR